MKPTIALVARTVTRSPELLSLAQSRFAAAHIKVAPREADFLDGQELAHFLRPASGAIIGREVISAAVLQQCPNLKAIAMYGVGTDNIDFLACQKNGVQVLESPGVNADAAAEFTLGLMISLCRNICLTNAAMRQGQWQKNGGTQLSGKTVAIIGVGAIGQRVARHLDLMGCHLLLVDLRDVTDFAHQLTHAQQISLEQALATADIVSLHMPLNSTTRGYLSAERLAIMAPQSWLINAARGELVDLSAAKKRLQSNELAGLGVDVYPNEPHFDQELVQLPQVVATPHIAGNAREAVHAAGSAAISKLAEFLQL